MKFNTAVSALMILLNKFEEQEEITKDDYRTFLILLNPIAPHITEELNEVAGFDKPISSCDWPEYDESKTIDDEIEIPVQVNGKLKTTITINLDENESSVKEKVHNAIDSKLDGKTIVKEIYVKI